MSTHHIQVTVNGVPQEAEVEARRLLVHFLREDLNLTGTHIGCDTTSCGACIERACCAQAAACAANTSCIDLANCATACTDSACIDACVEAHGAGLADLEALLGCGNASCATDCGGA